MEYHSGSIFPTRLWNEYYRTIDFKELAYMHGDTEKSFEKTRAMLNRIRHEDDGAGTPVRTLHEGSVKEGLAIQRYLKNLSVDILSQHDFTNTGVPEVPLFLLPLVEISGKHRDSALVKCADETYTAQDLQENDLSYESPLHTVIISMDDVQVKRQESTHKKKGSHENPQKKKPRKNTSNTVCTVNYSQKKYALNGYTTKNVIPYLIACLVHNNLLGKRFQFFTDGLPILNAAIEERFSWYTNKAIILDWFHLKKKCKERLSMGMNNKKEKGAFLYNKLFPALWSGQVEHAIEILKNIDVDLIKDEVQITKLIEYLTRNTSYIPCYKVRKELGLCNSSAECEKMNDILVSNRQKNNGMSWVKEGSVALASLSAVKKNHEDKQWFETGTLSYKLAA